MDKYTKAVLTVIAVCLMIQTAKDIAFIEPTHASGPQKVILCDEIGSNCASLTPNGSLKVFNVR